MGRCLYLQDDTGLAPLSHWTHTDGYSVSIADEPVVAALERYSGLDLAPLRRVADGELSAGYWEAEPWLKQIDVPLDAVPASALMPLRAAAAAQRVINEAAWVAATDLLDLLGQLCTALGPAEGPADPTLLRLLRDEHGDAGYDDASVTGGVLHQELVDLLVMLRWAIVRGASRVRLWLSAT